MCSFSNAKIIVIPWIRVKPLALSRLTTSTVPVIFTRQPSWNCHRPIPRVFRVQKFKSVPSAVLAQQGRFNARKGKYLVKIVVLVRFKMKLDRPRAKRVRSRLIKIKLGKRRARLSINLAMQVPKHQRQWLQILQPPYLYIGLMPLMKTIANCK